jgi:phytol kinase
LLNSLLPLESAPALWVQLAIAVAWLALVVLLAEIVDRGFKAEPELVRKVVHIGTGNIILLAWWLQIPAWVGISASVIFSVIALLSHRIPIMPTINSIGRKSLGTFFYANSFGILIGLFWNSQPYYAVLGILVMTWGDGLAALIGQRWGQHAYELWGMKKSWEGSLTMTAVSYGVSSLILLNVQGAIWQTWLVALAVAIAATVLEAFSKYGIDNLTVPVGVAVLGYLLNQALIGL